MIHYKPRYRVNEAFQLLGLSRSVGYERMAAGALQSVKDGRRSFITADEIDRYTAVDLATSKMAIDFMTAEHMDAARRLKAAKKAIPCCSFCGKSEMEVQHLVHGPSVFICDECLEFCIHEMLGQPLRRLMERQ